MNLRSHALTLATGTLELLHPGQPVNLIEVGCMYQEVEGLSTLVLANYLANREGGGRFIAIDNDPSHIESCQNLLRARNPRLLDFVEFRLGNSLDVLPGAIADLGQVHFYSLDGGAHPEVCLEEFELSVNALVPDGIILVDDAQPMQPTEHYSLPRPYGKATFILPALLVCEYMGQRDDIRRARPNATRLNSAFIKSLEGFDYERFRKYGYIVIGKGHKLLAYGNNRYLQALLQFA